MGWEPSGDAYVAAVSLGRCIPVVTKHDKLDVAQRKAAEQFYADAAMRMLREAVARGYKDAAKTQGDDDLAPLRGRADFQALVAGMGAKAK